MKTTGILLAGVLCLALSLVVATVYQVQAMPGPTSGHDGWFAAAVGRSTSAPVLLAKGSMGSNRGSQGSLGMSSGQGSNSGQGYRLGPRCH